MPIPPDSRLSYAYDAFEKSIVYPMARTLDPSLLVRKLSGNRREAANVDEQDRVRLPTTWWQPRLGFKPVSVEDMLTGPGPGTGPAPGPWTVVRAKTEGVSKGFQIKDAEGVRFAIKIDPAQYPELGTSPDVIASKLYWAAGYNVPDNSIAYFHRGSLTIAPNATYTVGGRKIPITDAFIDGLLRDVPKQADGGYRVVASRFLEGQPLGEWRYDGQRKGDREDQIPHELRREIRGMWAINAWINHTDCSARNTLDMYVTDGGRSFVRHHMIDFSGCLGSASVAPQSMRSGHEYFVDYEGIAKSWLTLALPPFEWERATEPNLPGVGFVESQTFDPADWRPYLPNPAFDQRTERDIKWGAHIVAAFSDELIRAAVESGRYSDPRAVEYLVRVLEERRDKIVQRWLTAEEVGEQTAPPSGQSEAVVPTLVSTASDTTLGIPDSASAQTAPADNVPKLGVGTRARRAVGNFASDGWAVATAPFRARGSNLLWMAGALGAEAVIYANDQEILDATIRNREDPVFKAVIDVGKGFEPVGFMGRTNPIYLVTLGAGYALNVRLLRTIPTEILESHLLAGGVRNLGKVLVGRRHPYEKMGPHTFDFGHGTSFPSGHTSVGFELATIASMNAHSLPVTIAAYSLATTLAVQRVESLNHWPSDVFIAAAYGTLVARTVVTLHEKREGKGAPGFSVIPDLSNDGRVTGVRMTRTF